MGMFLICIRDSAGRLDAQPRESPHFFPSARLELTPKSVGWPKSKIHPRFVSWPKTRRKIVTRRPLFLNLHFVVVFVWLPVINLFAYGGSPRGFQDLRRCFASSLSSRRWLQPPFLFDQSSSIYPLLVAARSSWLVYVFGFDTSRFSRCD